ncbi:MAG: hypothetical protein AAGD22_02205 [Verrucomicrobiota bacterium]
MTTSPPVPRPDADVEQLNLLAIFHYILGGLHIFISCFFLLYVFMGLFFSVNLPDLEAQFQATAAGSGSPQPSSPPADAPISPSPTTASEIPVMPAPFAAIGWFMTAFGTIAFLVGATFGVLTIISGRKLNRHTARTFSTVIAAINCIFVPLGTALGVFTIIVLNRQAVQQLYQNQSGSLIPNS